MLPGRIRAWLGLESLLKHMIAGLDTPSGVAKLAVVMLVLSAFKLQGENPQQFVRGEVFGSSVPMDPSVRTEGVLVLKDLINTPLIITCNEKQPSLKSSPAPEPLSPRFFPEPASSQP